MNKHIEPPVASGFADDDLRHPAGYGDGGGALGFPEIRAFLWRQRWVLIGITAAAVLAGLILTMLTTPVYKAATTVRVELDAGQLLEGQEFTDPYIASNEFTRYVRTLGGVLESRNMALRVVDDLELQREEAIVGEAAGQAPPPGLSAEAWDARRRDLAAAVLMGNIEVEIPTDNRIMEIGYASTDGALAAKIANAYAANFLADDLDRSIDSISYAREYLEDQIADTRDRLQEAEQQAIGYAQANRILGQPQAGTGESQGSVGTSQTITYDSLVATNRTYAEARAARISAQERWNLVSGVPAMELPEVQTNPAIQNMVAERGQLEARLSDLRERYRDDYPDVREANAAIAALDRQIASAAADVKRSIRNAYTTAARQERALGGELDRVSDLTLAEQNRRVQYNLIDREVEAVRQQLAVLLQRYNQIVAASNLRTSNIQLLDPAITPRKPFSPNLMKNLLLALVLGVGLAGAIAILRELLDNRLHSVEDVERKLGVTPIGQTPYVTDDIEEELASQFSPLSEAYSSIRASVDYAMGPGGTRVIQVTSSQPGEGKTVSAYALARKFAALGKRTLLVDMDLRRPGVSRMLDLRNAPAGLVDVLYSRRSLSETMVSGQHDNLSILPVREVPGNPIEILSSGLVPEFLDRHRADFDTIILDSSPLLGIADAPLLARYVDAVLFVVEANRVNSTIARRALRRLADVDANVLGALVTKFRALEAGESYDYQYRYYSYAKAEA